MIPRLATIFWMCVIAVAAFGLYMVKYRVLDIQKEIARTERELDAERENLRVASAEWAYLNRPERLQALAEKYLPLAPMKGVQIGSVAQVAYPGQREKALADSKPAGRNARAVGGPFIPASAIARPDQE